LLAPSTDGGGVGIRGMLKTTSSGNGGVRRLQGSLVGQFCLNHVRISIFFRSIFPISVDRSSMVSNRLAHSLR
ncbi:hypothetical protein PFISCL1PPCAC_6568, partial [Pristionchus fissidentatus]